MKPILTLISVILINSNFFAQKELIPFRMKNKWGYSDLELNIKIQTKYDSVGFFTKSKYLSNKIAFVKKNNKFGIINDKEKIIIPLIYSSIIEEGHTGTAWDRQTNRFLVKKDNKFGIINIKNQTIIPIKYDTIFIKDHISKDIYLYYGKKENKYYKLNLNNVSKVSEDTFYEKSNTFLRIVPYPENDDNSNTIARLEKWKSNYLEENKPILDSISTFITKGNISYFKTYRKGKVGFIGQFKNNFKRYDFNIFPKYDALLEDDVIGNENNKYFVFLIKKNGKIGVIDYNENFLMPLKPYGYVRFSRYSIHTKKDGFFGIYIYEDNTNIEPKYEYIKHSGFGGLFKIKQHGKWGYINKKGLEYFKN